MGILINAKEEFQTRFKQSWELLTSSSFAVVLSKSIGCRGLPNAINLALN